MPRVQIRRESPQDVDAIRALTRAAFRNEPLSSQTEAAIVDALRDAGALRLSLVAMENGAVVGHVAFSPVTINGESNGWYGLGPVSVRPDRQRQGIGQALIRAGLEHVKQMDAQGCVVLGSPDYYRRFGFVSDPELRFRTAPAEYFQRLSFRNVAPKGEVSYHAAFNAT